MNNHELRVWEAEVVRAEEDLMHVLPAIPGGKRINEGTMEYAERALERISNAQQRYTYAQAKLALLKKGMNE